MKRIYQSYSCLWNVATAVQKTCAKLRENTCLAQIVLHLGATALQKY